MLINLSALKLKDHNNINEVKNLEQDLYLSHSIITASTRLNHINNERIKKAESREVLKVLVYFTRKSFLLQNSV